MHHVPARIVTQAALAAGYLRVRCTRDAMVWLRMFRRGGHVDDRGPGAGRGGRRGVGLADAQKLLERLAEPFDEGVHLVLHPMSDGISRSNMPGACQWRRRRSGTGWGKHQCGRRSSAQHVTAINTAASHTVKDRSETTETAPGTITLAAVGQARRQTCIPGAGHALGEQHRSKERDGPIPAYQRGQCHACFDDIISRRRNAPPMEMALLGVCSTRSPWAAANASSLDFR